MILPRFNLDDDPGPSFATLLRRVDTLIDTPNTDGGSSGALGHLTAIRSLRAPATELTSTNAQTQIFTTGVRHGTTCVAISYANGVVLAGDRRVTSGNFISHHRIEKVFAADSHAGVAVAGAAGPAAEIVRLFQLQLEHYEKVEGTQISLEGKANQLSQLVRSNLPSAMQGLVVVPIFAGFDLTAETGRIFEYDITGGRYEERDYAATGSGSMHAETVIKLGHHAFQNKMETVDLALKALLVAADSDSATGGPDPLRDIYPVVVVIDMEGYRRIGDDKLRRRTNRLMRQLNNRSDRDLFGEDTASESVTSEDIEP